MPKQRKMDAPDTGGLPTGTSRHQTMVIDHDAEPAPMDFAYLEKVTPSRNPMTGEIHGEQQPEEEAKDTEEAKEAKDPEGDTPAEEAEPPEAEEEVDYKKRYEELHRRFGEQGNELGNLRRIVDTHLMQPMAPPKRPEETEDAKSLVDRFVADPDSVIREIKDQAAQEALTRIQAHTDAQGRLTRLNEKHPDRMNIVQSSEFHDWITSQNVIPRSVLAIAENDPEAASFVLDQYKARGNGQAKPAVKPPADPKAVAEKIATKRRMAANATGVGTSSGGEGERIFSRYELIKMQTQDPDKYAIMQPEIMQAYRDGRVR